MSKVLRFLDVFSRLLMIALLVVVIVKLHNENQHTRSVQKAGEPVGVCLLDAMKAVSPLLLQVPSVEAPLRAYVELQSHRYTNVKCPIQKEAVPK